MDTDTTSRLCWLSSMAPPSTWTFLSPKAWGLETLGTETRSSSHLKVSPAPFTRLPMCSARLVLSLCDRSDAPGLQGVGQRDCTSVSGRPGLPVSLSKSEKPHRCCCLRDCWGPLGVHRQLLVASTMDGQIKDTASLQNAQGPENR